MFSTIKSVKIELFGNRNIMCSNKSRFGIAGFSEFLEFWELDFSTLKRAFLANQGITASKVQNGGQLPRVLQGLRPGLGLRVALVTN